MATDAMGNVTGMPMDMSEVAEGYRKDGVFGAIFGLIGSVLKNIFGKLGSLFSGIKSMFGFGSSEDAPDKKPADKPATPDTPAAAVAAVAAAPAAKVEKPFDPMSPEAYNEWSAKMIKELETKFGVTLDAKKREKLEQTILPKYRNDAQAITDEVIAKQEVNLGMVFRTPAIMLGFVSDLVSADIVHPETVVMNYVEDGSDMVVLGLKAATGAIGLGSYSSEEIAEALGAKMKTSNPEEQKTLSRIFCHQGALVTALIGGLSAGIARTLMGFSPLQAGLPSELRTTSAAFFGRQQSMADELVKIATALEPTGITPAYVTELQTAVKSTAAQVQFTDLWHKTVETGTQAELKTLSERVSTLRTDPLYRSSAYLDAVQARVNTLAANGLPVGMNGLDDLSRDIAGVGMQHTPKAPTMITFQERLSNSVLKDFAPAQTNARLLMSELANVSQGLDARLSMTNRVSRAFNNMTQAMRVERLPGAARETIYAVNKGDVAKWSQNAKIVALNSPELFRNVMRGAGVIAITGLSAANTDENHSFIENLATNMAWTVRFGPLAFALGDLERYKLDLKNGNFTGMAELALVTAQTAMDVTAGVKFAAKTLIRGQMNWSTVGQFGRFMAPVAYDAVELGAGSIRALKAANHLRSYPFGKAAAPAEIAAAEAKLLSSAAPGARPATSLLSRLLSGASVRAGASAEAGGFLGSMKSAFSVKGLGIASTVLTGVLMADSAYAFARGKMDAATQEKLEEKLKADGVLTPDGMSVNYAKAGYLIRNANPTEFPAESKKLFFERVVFDVLDASLKIDPSAPEGIVNDRQYEVAISASTTHKRDQDVTYLNLNGVPFQVKHSGDMVTVTFMNGPVHPHEQQRIIYAFNSMGMDAEVEMDINAQVQYYNKWYEYTQGFSDNAVVAAEAKARGIEPLPDGTPNRAEFLKQCREEFMILTGITDPVSTSIPPAIRETIRQTV